MLLILLKTVNLKKDLEIYNSFSETKGLGDKTIDKLLVEAKKQFIALDRKLIFYKS